MYPGNFHSPFIPVECPAGEIVKENDLFFAGWRSCDTKEQYHG